MSNIELTVGLPLYRAKYIAWAALESLCRQQSIDFDWELIVIEETMDSALPFGKDKILLYTECLEKVGCRNIVYIPLDKWIPLSLKWFMIVDNVSPTSTCMLFQAGDCYSSPGRLKETLRLFKTENADWVHSRFHVYYNIADEKIIIIDHTKSGHPVGSIMAIKLSLLKQLTRKGMKSSVDAFFYNQCRSVMEKNFKIVYDITDNWKYSISTSGLNNLTGRHKWFDKGIDRSDIIKPLIPEDILQMLVESKKYIHGWKRI